jgi:hypothetical protein
MRRQLALVPILFLLPLAACGVRTDDTTAAAPPATATTAPTRTASPAARPAVPNQPAGTTPAGTTTKVVRVAKAKASGSGDPRWGTQYAELKSSKLSTRQITYNLILWYDGREAVKACAEDHVKPAENDYCTGYYSRDNNPKLRTLGVYPDAPIRMMVTGEMKRVDLKTFLANVVDGSIIRFSIDANRIMKLDQVFLP